MNVFFLKQVISALMIFVDLLSPFVYLHFQRICLCHINALKEGKTMSALIVLSFYFVSFILNVIVFDYNGLKQALFCKQNQSVCYKFLFFHRNLIYAHLKKQEYLPLYVERLGY